MAWLLQEAMACPAVGQACAGSQCRVSVGLPGAAVQHHQCLGYCGAGGERAPDLGAAAGDQHQGRCSAHQCTEQQVMSRARCVTAAEDCYRAGHRDLQTVPWRTCIKSTLPLTGGMNWLSLRLRMASMMARFSCCCRMPGDKIDVWLCRYNGLGPANYWGFKQLSYRYSGTLTCSCNAQSSSASVGLLSCTTALGKRQPDCDP
jgi:hypothetical protein